MIERPQAWADLTRALTRLAEHGTRVPCLADPHGFASDHPAERQAAAHRCAACPAQHPCATYAEAAAEPFHVWGGTDRAPLSRPRKEAK